MQSAKMIRFLTLLVSSSTLVAPSFAASPLTPNEVKQNESPITIQETLERAYMQNTDLDAARAGLRATDETVSQANADWRPSLSVTGRQDLSRAVPIGPGGTTRGANTGYTAQITQNVYKGGSSEATLSQRESEVLAGKASLFSQEQQTLNTGVQTHTSITAAEDILNYRKKSEDFYRINLERARARFEVGEGTSTDVALIEGGYESAKADVAASIRDLETAKANYLRQVGTPPGKLAPANIIVCIPKAYEDALEVAKVKNPTVIQARYNLEAAQYNVKVQMAGLLPEVNVNATIGNQRDFDSSRSPQPTVRKQTNYGFGTTVAVPIYSQGIPNSQVRQAYQTVAQNKVQLVGAQRQVEEAVRTAWEALLAAREEVKARVASVKAQELAVEGAVEELNVGTKSFVDVRELEQNLIDEQVRLVQAQQTLITASYGLISTMGRLTARDLSLKVKYYDPDAYYREYQDAWIQFWEGKDLRYVKDGDPT